CSTASRRLKAGRSSHSAIRRSALFRTKSAKVSRTDGGICGSGSSVRQKGRSSHVSSMPIGHSACDCGSRIGRRPDCRVRELEEIEDEGSTLKKDGIRRNRNSSASPEIFESEQVLICPRK